MTKKKDYHVYSGSLGRELVYIGTTTQKPHVRFNWHKANGKPFNFIVLKTFNNPEEMLDYEHEMILKHLPRCNKKLIRQNLNVKLSLDQLKAREGDQSWCQSCLKRRVNPGYTFCFRCGKGPV